MMITLGSTTNFVVSYDNSLSDGPAAAQAALDYCEYDLARLSMLFAVPPSALSLPIQINIVSGGGGADNNGYNIINVLHNPINDDPEGVPAIVVAEEAEIFMVAQNLGWISYWSNGEALSRVSAQILYPNRAALFSVGNQWLNGPATSWNTPRSDCVDTTTTTDQDAISYGCGSLFLNYLAYQLNIPWPAIYQAGAPTKNTLAETAGILGVTSAWQNFINLINVYLPSPMPLPPGPTGLGQIPGMIDDPHPFGPLPASVPALYMRHNPADTGTSHTGSLSDSPDIILKNNPVANPQATYSTPASIASDTESDAYVVTGQDNYVYLRVWNLGADAPNVFASVYWSPPATLVTPNLWTLAGYAYYPDVPTGSVVEVSTPGITWPSDQLPGDGHYCFVALAGNAEAPPPNLSSFANFDDFMNYIYANNNITWRNFNVGFFEVGQVAQLPFLITGAWDAARPFSLETEAELPEGSRLVLQVPQHIGRGLQPPYPGAEEAEDALRIPLPANGRQSLGRIHLPAGTAATSHLLVHVPEHRQQEPIKVVIRQLYGEREAGRITWFLRQRRLSE